MYKFSIGTLCLVAILLLTACQRTQFPDSKDLSPQNPESVVLSNTNDTSVELPKSILEQLKHTPDQLSTAPFEKFFEKAYLIDVKSIKHNTIIKSQSGRSIMPINTIIYANGTLSSEDYIISEPSEKFQDDHYSGFLIEPIGEATLIKHSPKLNTLKITQESSEITNGDWLIPKKELDMQNPTHIVKLDHHIVGQVVGSTSDQFYTAESHSVLLDIGKQKGLVSGALIYFFTEPEKAEDDAGKNVIIPGHQIGMGIVYRVSSSMSIALILDSLEEIEKGTIVSTYAH